jgi:tetratricopeptide (TPR) repeat protein
MALMESLFVRDYREEGLADQYRRLTDRIQSRVSDNESRLVAELNAQMSNPDKNRDWSPVVDLAIRLAPISSAALTLVSALRNLIGPNNPLSSLPLHALLSQESSSKAPALNNWGNALSGQAKGKGGEEADWLFAAACEKYAAAIRLRPAFEDAFGNWGAALGEQAKRKGAAEAERLFEASYEKYAEAVRLKADYALVLNNWGVALMEQAKLKRLASPRGAESEELLGLARAKLLEAHARAPQASVFNLACLEAVCGNAPKSIAWLRKAVEPGVRITKEKIALASDFDAIRMDPGFVRFVAALPEK